MARFRKTQRRQSVALAIVSSTANGFRQRSLLSPAELDRITARRKDRACRMEKEIVTFKDKKNRADSLP
jgi:hypothetical protein